MEPLPDEYAVLRRWFPTLTARAEALALSRETLTRWERSTAAARVRPATALAVRTLAGVAGDVERLVGDPLGTGRWLLAPQPALRGGTAAELARDGSDEALRALTRLATPEDPSVVPEATIRPVTRQAAVDGTARPQIEIVDGPGRSRSRS